MAVPSDEVSGKDHAGVSLTSAAGRLVQTSEGYLKMRRRFVAVYGGDIKGNNTRNSTAIKEGNITAHEGDAVAEKALGLGVSIKFFSVSGHPPLSSHPSFTDDRIGKQRKRSLHPSF